MKKIFIALSLFFWCSCLYAWPSESGSGVVSDNQSIVRTSLEATQVLKSDQLGILLGENRFGGTVNYSSTDSGGIFSTRNVASSRDTVLLSNDQYNAWLRTDGKQVRSGLSADNIYIIGDKTRIFGVVSAPNVEVASIFTTSINVTRVFVSGNTTITSTYTTGTCSFTFSNGLLRSASC